jgi:hypothetical protein
VELDMYAALEVHTEKTVAAGREEVKKFASLMEVCIRVLWHIQANFSLGIYYYDSFAR